MRTGIVPCPACFGGRKPGRCNLCHESRHIHPTSALLYADLIGTCDDVTNDEITAVREFVAYHDTHQTTY